MPIQFTAKSLCRVLVWTPGNEHKTPTKCGHLIYILAALNGILISMEVVKSPEKYFSASSFHIYVYKFILHFSISQLRAKDFYI